ncbi:isochorismatase hydrolase [Chaetoceros tenuissimus]|uniref:Isochorismatase hydrolase n=1 Tax=Chaetoceros tenuissimus TaxID=426638 RepID=A0AAD3HB76_9STRA|nr:isochorismatase hydrolase [Chaetoceros tenuissimus]
MSVAKAARSVGKLSPSTTAFFLCDIQERFRPLIYNTETIVNTAQYLTSMSKELSIPLIATQQYTKVFGNTLTDCFANGQTDIDELIQKNRIFEKKKFSMMTDEVQSYLDTNEEFQNRNSIVLFGIEAHVCVQQTCLDLLEQGKEVHIVCDGVSSQQKYDREMALKRMESAGAFLTTAQSLAFMLMQSAEHENFKAVSKLTVNHMKLENQFNQ